MRGRLKDSRFIKCGTYRSPESFQRIKEKVLNVISEVMEEWFWKVREWREELRIGARKGKSERQTGRKKEQGKKRGREAVWKLSQGVQGSQLAGWRSGHQSHLPPLRRGILGSARGQRFVDLNLTPRVFSGYSGFPPSANSTFTPRSEPSSD